MSFDTRMVLLWVLVVLNVILWIGVYLYYRKTFKKTEWISITEKPEQKLNTIEQMKETKEDRVQEFVEVRDKVDRIIAEKYTL